MSGETAKSKSGRNGKRLAAIGNGWLKTAAGASMARRREHRNGKGEK
jgi:hypothetical protein